MGQVGGQTVTAGDLRSRLEAILAVEIPENKFVFSKPKLRLGMTGGMGPVAGAELAVDLSNRLAEARMKAGKEASMRSGWQVVMMSDPQIETWKTEKMEAWQSVQSAINLYWFLGREEFKYTCIGSNTAHLMLQPSPPSNLLSIYEAVATSTKEQFPGEKIALMCTSLSMKHVDIGYGEIFKKHGLEFVKPTPAIQDKCMEGITYVKNPTEGAESARKAVDCFVECLLWYSDQGATVFCLSCTEIPVVLKVSVLRSDKRLADRNLKIVDSVAALGQMVTDTLMKEEEGEEEDY
jgi:aspartate/glutamate racemase